MVKMKSRSLNSKPDKRRATQHINRKIEMADDEAPEQRNPLLDMKRSELLAYIAGLQSQNMALHGQLTISHERMNNALRVLGRVFQFLFGLVFAYMTVLRTYKEAGNEKPIPVFWIAARVCELYEKLFERFDIKGMDLGPEAPMLVNLYSIANRHLNPGSLVADYCGILPAPPKEELCICGNLGVPGGCRRCGKHGPDGNDPARGKTEGEAT